MASRKSITTDFDGIQMKEMFTSHFYKSPDDKLFQY